MKKATPPRLMENDRAKILSDFQINTNKPGIVNQPDIVEWTKRKRVQ